MAKPSTLLERGNIFFFYCPKATRHKKPKLLDNFTGAQGFYLILHPEDKSLYRLFTVADKQLPGLEVITQKTLIKMAAVADDATGILAALGRQTHCKSLNKPFLAAHPCGEGAYVFFEHHEHSHFAYSLNLPEKLGEVQQGLHMTKQANYTIAIKNHLSLEGLPKTDLPNHLLKQFQGRVSIPLTNLDFINHPGVTFILMNGCQSYIAEIDFDDNFTYLINDLASWASHRPREPLLQGQWGF